MTCEKLDIVFLVDMTGSMKDEMPGYILSFMNLLIDFFLSLLNHILIEHSQCLFVVLWKLKRFING